MQWVECGTCLLGGNGSSAFPACLCFWICGCNAALPKVSAVNISQGSMLETPCGPALGGYTLGRGEKDHFQSLPWRLCWVLTWISPHLLPQMFPVLDTHKHANVLEDSGLTTINWFIFPAGQLFNFLLEVYKCWHCSLFGKGPKPSTVSLACSGI